MTFYINLFQLTICPFYLFVVRNTLSGNTCCNFGQLKKGNSYTPTWRELISYMQELTFKGLTILDVLTLDK